MKEDKKREELQKKVLQFQFMENNLKTLQERAQLVTQRIEELQRTMIALEDLDKTKPNKALIPIGSGNFVQGSIENTEEVLVNVGSGIIVTKKKQESKKMLEQQIKEFEKVLQQISTGAQAILIELQKIQEDIQKIQA